MTRRHPRWTELTAACLGLCTLTPMPCLAEPPTEKAQMAAGYLSQLVGGLVVVLAVILVLAWILRRFPVTQVQGQQAIEILAVRSIGARERLMLVQVGDEQILLGVSATGMRHLHTLKTNLDIAPAQPWSGDFATLFKRAGAQVSDR
jgi:flagellar protein FliO/FliZ